MYNGIVNVYKEKGFTSHDVVAKLRGITKQKKIGHTGTLDPDAEGVLPVCLGKGTKLCDLLTEKEKTYEAVLLLGRTTDTQDCTGTVLEEKPVQVSEDQVRDVLRSFVGTYGQIPPMYSAIKYQGKKLYELARAGVTIQRQPRQVTIHSIQIVEMELPRIRMEVHCSKGTYIRTLCQDIGEALGCGGCMEALKRTSSGQFLIRDSLTLDAIEQLEKAGKLEEVLLPIEGFFKDCPGITMLPEADKLVYNGNPFGKAATGERKMYLSPVRVYDSKGNFIGIYQYNQEKHCYFPKKLFFERDCIE